MKRTKPHPLLLLSPEDLDFVAQMVLASGSLKDLANVYAVSYPTIRSRLDALIERLRGAMSGREPDPLADLLAELIERGQLTSRDARAIRELARAQARGTRRLLMQPWFDPQTGNILGAIFGATLGGVGGGVGGPLAGWLVPQGRARALVLGWFGVLAVVGALLAAIGVSALVLGQPRHVWAPFLQVGVIVGAVASVVFVVVRRRYLQGERTRMDAHAFRRE